MILDPTEDQEFFRATTARYLADRAPATELRRLRDDPVGFSRDYWRGGAELGWTSLLVDEAHGGGSLSGSPVVDLTLVAYEFGRAAAPGPLVPTNLAAAALSDAGGVHSDLLDGLLSGEATAAWTGPSDTTEGRVDGDQIEIDGAVFAVESAGVADWILVTIGAGPSMTQVVVAAGTPGLSTRPMNTVDLTRRFDEVRFDGVRVPLDAAVGPIGGAGPAVARQQRLALVMANAESVGAMQRGFDMTVEWAADRYSFGRPLASYQALKHRFADMKVWLVASHAISDAAAVATDAGSPEADELVSVASTYIGERGSELLHDCVQLHGGIGVTFEHDLHLYLRRHTLDRTLYGTPEEHRRRVARMVLATEGAA